MPCKPVRARLLLKSGKAVARWNRLGIFYIQLKRAVEPNNQTLAVGIDPSSRFEGFYIVGTRDTVLNIMHEAVDWVKKAMERRRQMRRAKMYRKMSRRECRFDNRLRTRDSLHPSTKARWDAKLRILEELRDILPIQTAAVEDVKAEARDGQKRWNTSFSPLEVGKRYFYYGLKEIGLKVVTKEENETEELRERFGLRKIKSKSKPVFETHCVDSWVLAASKTGAERPTTKLP